MGEINLMQQALGEQWQQLSPALQAHYQSKNNTDIGVLDVEYPGWMQWYLNFLRLLGALVNRHANNIPTTVEKSMQGETQYWKRTLRFTDGKVIVFKSYWVSGGNNKLIEYVNPLLGLCMVVQVNDGQLVYQGQYYVVKLGWFQLPLPEWLILGHTTIVETALDEKHFAMDFRLRHPWFGQLFRYAGKFTTE